MRVQSLGGQMFQMIEAVGVSAVSFSDAAKNAVDQLIAKGKKVHFFEVVQQRGAVRENKIKEFQVIVKIAFEME
jgi:dodecin